MTSKERVEAAAHKAVTEFVNGQGCNSTADVKRCLEKLAAMALHALDVVTNGKAEKLS